MLRLAVVLLALISASISTAAEDVDAIKATLTRQAAAWDAAIWTKDRSAVEANLGEGFRHVDPYGTVSTRAQFVADLLDPALTIDPYVVEGLDVRVLGDTALLTGETRMTGTYQGKPFRSHYRYVDVYHRQGDRWAVVYIQITRFKE